MDIVNKGKHQVILMISVLLILDILAVFAVANSRVVCGGSISALNLLIKSGVRLSLSACLYYFLYQGYSWARITATVLMGMAFLLSIVLLLISFNPYTAVVSVIMGKSFYTLVLSKPALAFLKRNKLEEVREEQGSGGG